MRKCAQLGCLAGGAVVQVVGAEMTPESWRWLFARSGPSLLQNVAGIIPFCHLPGHLAAPSVR